MTIDAGVENTPDTVAANVGLAIRQVGCTLLELAHRPPSHVHVACVESFFVNVRLLAEFFRHGTHRHDFRCVDAFGYIARESDEWRSLTRDHHDLASRHVVRFSRERLTEEAAPITEAALLAELSGIAADTLSVVRDFVVFLERGAHPEAGRVHRDLSDSVRALMHVEDR